MLEKDHAGVLCTPGLIVFSAPTHLQTCSTNCIRTLVIYSCLCFPCGGTVFIVSLQPPPPPSSFAYRLYSPNACDARSTLWLNKADRSIFCSHLYRLSLLLIGMLRQLRFAALIADSDCFSYKDKSSTSKNSVNQFLF